MMDGNVVASLTCLSLAVISCSTDHDLLAQKPNAGVDGGLDSSGGPDGDHPSRDAFTASDGRDPEPPGPWMLTLLNGVVDQDAVRFCFARVTDGGEEAPDLAPMPKAPGLPFGAKMVLPALTGVDFATMDVHPYLVLGASEAPADFTCRTILARRQNGEDADVGAAGPVAVSLPLLPAGTLADARSYLAVATGCALEWPEVDAGTTDAGAADATVDATLDAGPDRADVCGRAASAQAGLLLVRLSRTNFSYQLGFQVVHASAATPAASLALDNGATNLTLFFADDLNLGQIDPRNQPGLVERSIFGPSLGTARVRIHAANSNAFPSIERSLSAVLLQSQLQESSLLDGHNYSFVMLGAGAGKAVGDPFQPFRTVLVENAPRLDGPEPQ
ncbi:MAG TPA: hypothetical protein VF881_12980 [Polyangiaceae bacterium]